jgi:hypothetical protein
MIEIKQQFIITDPETGKEYACTVLLDGKGVEVQIGDAGVERANVYVEVYGGQSQVVISNSEETYNDPQVIPLFREEEVLDA